MVVDLGKNWMSYWQVHVDVLSITLNQANESENRVVVTNRSRQSARVNKSLWNSRVLWRPYWKQPFFDVCYFLVLFTCFLIIWCELRCRGIVLYLWCENPCCAETDCSSFVTLSVCFDNARPWISGLEHYFQEFWIY